MADNPGEQYERGGLPPLAWKRYRVIEALDGLNDLLGLREAYTNWEGFERAVRGEKSVLNEQIEEYLAELARHEKAASADDGGGG